MMISMRFALSWHVDKRQAQRVVPFSTYYGKEVKVMTYPEQGWLVSGK